MAGAAVAERRLQDRQQLLLVARERARDKRRAELDRQRAGVDRRQLVGDAVLGLRTEIGGRRELALRQAVAPVVFDDVDDRQIAPHQVHELADADGPGVAVTADADGQQLAVREHGAGADRGHAAMDRVEAVRRAQKVRRALARTADPGQLDDVPRIDTHLVERLDDALGDGVVAAAGAERRLAAAIGLQVETDAVRLLWRVRSRR